MGYEDARPDSARENGGLVEPPRDHDTPYLSAGERRLLEAGKAEHRETTATAKRALQARRVGAGGERSWATLSHVGLRHPRERGDRGGSGRQRWPPPAAAAAFRHLPLPAACSTPSS